MSIRHGIWIPFLGYSLSDAVAEGGGLSVVEVSFSFGCCLMSLDVRTWVFSEVDKRTRIVRSQVLSVEPSLLEASSTRDIIIHVRQSSAAEGLSVV